MADPQEPAHLAGVPSGTPVPLVQFWGVSGQDFGTTVPPPFPRRDLNFLRGCFEGYSVFIEFSLSTYVLEANFRFLFESSILVLLITLLNWKLILPFIDSINSRFLLLVLSPLVLDYLGFGCDFY